MTAAMAKPQSGNTLPRGYKLGEYVIEYVLGHGGFGITYRARDTQLSSTVAIKEYFPRSLVTRGESSTIQPHQTGLADFQWGLQEFLKEARALAKFKHNNIVRVLRFVETNGTAYMVMEYEDGESLDVYLKRSGGYLNEQMLLSVFIPVLSGLQAVHDAGLLHLDIKPDNIYLRTDGRPMLIDFGSARQTKGGGNDGDKIALTPAFSAIEQYPGMGEKGPWTDVYSMGATLYRCIVGKPPVGALERHQATEKNHDDPYELAAGFERPIYSRHIRASADSAMQLEPEKRPQTAQLLQKALMGQRIVGDDIKSVKRPSENFRPDMADDLGAPMVIRAKKKGRPFLEKLFFTMVLLPAVILFTIKLLVQFGAVSESTVINSIEAVSRQASARFDELDANLYENWRIRIKSGGKPVEINKVEPRVEPEEPPFVKPVSSFQPDKTLTHTLTGHREEILALAFLKKGQVLASLGGEGGVRLWDTTTGRLLHKIGGKQEIIGTLAASPMANELAWSVGDTVYFHDVQSKQKISSIGGHDGNIRGMYYSGDGALLAIATDNKSLYVRRRPEGEVAFQLTGLEHDVNALVFSPNGRLLALADTDGKIKIYGSSNGGEIAQFIGYQQGKEILALSYSPDGHWLASSGPENFLKLWDTGIEVRDRQIENVSGALNQLAFSPDNRWLLATDGDGAVQVWDLDQGELKHKIASEHGTLTSLVITPDGQTLATGGTDNKIRLWR